MTFRSKIRFAGASRDCADLSRTPGRFRGIGLAEAIASLVILGLFSSGLMVVINRCMDWSGDSIQRMRAFEVARDNMEKLLSLDSVEEMSESGDSKEYPGIEWQTDVEAFYEPVTSRMWVRAVCKTKYTDANGEEQTIELEHWLTNLTKEQLLALAKREGEALDDLGGQVFETLAEAAAYAGVDEDTIDKWIQNGLPVFPDGSIPKGPLDTFKEYDGNPPADKVAAMPQKPEDLPARTDQAQDSAAGQDISDDDWFDEIEPMTGMTYGDIEKNPDKFWEIIASRLK
ncbi:MAG: hypothetical protein JW720_15975 [Sedimentisphaerales bacterium]|nr:hypothetical protein [Sedimentisphaerales bacterium]